MQLTNLLTQLKKPSPPATDVRQFVRLCHNIARTYLNQKVITGRLDPQFFALSVDDLAMDCIASLFERNDRGEFVRIKCYFNSFDINELSEEILFARTRRLVFGAINDELFRLYKLEDPSLGNVIRCIKAGLKFIPDLFAERIDGEVWLYIEHKKSAYADLPVMPFDYIYVMLNQRFKAKVSVRQLIREFADILKTQRNYRKRYPLIGLAYLIRILHTALADVEDDFPYPADVSMRVNELCRLIRESSRKVKDRMEYQYVVRNKFPRKTYNSFFPAIESILTAQYVKNDGFDRSFFEHIKSYNSGMSPVKYDEKYRKFFEYLVKLSREELIKKIRKDF